MDDGVGYTPGILTAGSNLQVRLFWEQMASATSADDCSYDVFDVDVVMVMLRAPNNELGHAVYDPWSGERSPCRAKYHIAV